MAKRFRIACHLIQWRGEQNENPEKVMKEVAAAGYDGVEGLKSESAEDLVSLAATAARYGLHIVNVGAPDPRMRVHFNATLGNDACEVPAARKRDYGGSDPKDSDFAAAAEALKADIDYARAHNLKPFHHAHLGTMIETQEDAERMLAAAPGLFLLFDTGHLQAAGSDPMKVLESCGERIGHVHLKDFYADDPGKWDHRTCRLYQDGGRFEELGAGNMGMDVGAVLKGLEDIGYDGWISVELDRAPREPAESARVNREFLRKLGY